MDRKKYLKYAGFAVLLIGTSSLTYYLAPAKVKIKEVEKIVKVKGETKIVNRDIVRIVEKRPDGTIIEKEIDKSKERTDKDEKVVSEKKKEKTVIRKKKDWLVGGGILVDPIAPENPVWYGQVQRRVLGEVYVGIIATTDRSVGVGLSFRF